VRRALAEGPRTRSELATALGRSSRYRHLRTVVAEGNDTLLKPLTWQGDMGLGPVRDGEATFLRLDDIPGWAGIPDLDEAGPAVITAYFRTYGPATADRVYDWFSKGLGGKRQAISRWLDQLDERLESITIEGDSVLVLQEDIDDLRTTPASTAVRLLPGRDPWVMAPGTSDARVVPPVRREAVSRSANLVISGGAVAGTWTLRSERLNVVWFKESGRVPRTALDQEVAALAKLLDRPLDPEVEVG
ncbi:MAG: winged helix DNA-binding domain-containing protein, partial [Nocardioidaceae bacterium]|nr:winged helix DNA-binding domain-containing protein [Nocardioidaceae bacterium]